jgi:hypothetical protein
MFVALQAYFLLNFLLVLCCLMHGQARRQIQSLNGGGKVFVVFFVLLIGWPVMLWIIVKNIYVKVRG